MKTRTLNAYIARIDRAVALLAGALAAGAPPPPLEALAAAAHFSPFHFHRIYRALTGETLAQTTARLRSDRAAHLLSQRGQAVTEVALASGFATPQAFARAFRAATGLTPSQAREQAPALPTAPPAGSLLSVRIESLEPLQVVALRHVGEHARLDTAYTRLFAWAGEQGLLDGLRGLFGLALDDPRDTPPAATRFDAMLALGDALPPLAADLHVAVLAGGEHLLLRHQGHYGGLYPLLDALYLHALPAHGLEPADAPAVFRYLNEPDQTPEAEWLTEIRLPVRSLGAG